MEQKDHMKMEGRKFGNFKDRPTFWISLVVIVTFVLFGVVWPDAAEETFNNIFDFMVVNFGWSFMLAASFFLLMTIIMFLTPIGQIRLGRPGEDPEYSNYAWFGMLFSCGMGIGLLFWGVSEPIWHYIWPPHAEANTAQAAHDAIRYSFFHWGFHPWGIYSIVAGSLAYFSYRKGLPMLLSSTLYPILGEDGIYGFWGGLVNIIGVFATLFGLATSLGLGAMQIGGGLETLFGIPNTGLLQVGIVAAVTAVAVISTYTGIDRGIKYLSQLNITIAIILLILVFVLGPTLFILDIFTHGTGAYLQNIIGDSLQIDAIGTGTKAWYEAWSIFYWAWWIAWAPFVGTFIARVSRGRTIRQFVLGVLLVPTAVSMVWFAIFGGSAIHFEHIEEVGTIIEAVEIDEALGFFESLELFPASSILIFAAMLSVAIFFATSSDSGTYVAGMLTSGGDPDPPLPLRIIWGVLEGSIAAVLLFTGGLAALQTSSIIGGFPFMIVMFFMVYCLFKSLIEELREGTLPKERKKIYDAIEELREEKEDLEDQLEDV